MIMEQVKHTHNRELGGGGGGGGHAPLEIVPTQSP